MNVLLVNEVIALRKIRDGLANELKRQLLLRLQNELEEQMQEPEQPQQRLNSPQYPIITGI